MRYKGQRTKAAIDRDFPYQVEVPIPLGGLGNRLNEMDAFARQLDHASRPAGNAVPGEECVRYCFKTPEDAAAFHLRFAPSDEGKV